MSENQEEILEKIRERVFERQREIKIEADKEADIEATLQALEEITDVPRAEMNRIADEIRSAHEIPDASESDPGNVPTSITDQLPATVREALGRLPRVLRDEFLEEYRIQSRNTVISYLLWLIPPPFSCHYLYIRKPFRQILFFLTCGGLFLWWFVDLFRLPQIVQEDNRKTARKLLKKMFRQSLRRIDQK